MEVGFPSPAQNQSENINGLWDAVTSSRCHQVIPPDGRPTARGAPPVKERLLLGLRRSQGPNADARIWDNTGRPRDL